MNRNHRVAAARICGIKNVPARKLDLSHNTIDGCPFSVKEWGFLLVEIVEEMGPHAESYSFLEKMNPIFSHIDEYKPFYIKTRATRDAGNGNPHVAAKKFLNWVCLQVRFPTLLQLLPGSAVNPPPIPSEWVEMTAAVLRFERVVTP